MSLYDIALAMENDRGTMGARLNRQSTVFRSFFHSRRWTEKEVSRTEEPSNEKFENLLLLVSPVIPVGESDFAGSRHRFVPLRRITAFTSVWLGLGVNILSQESACLEEKRKVFRDSVLVMLLRRSRFRFSRSLFPEALTIVQLLLFWRPLYRRVFSPSYRLSWRRIAGKTLR